MARATFAGMLAHDPDSRPFILTRAAFSGAQTVAALWGGDNSSVWEHLAGSLPYLLNLGLSGMPFVGVDIGGFNGLTNGELLARWFQAGAFYPFCRNHAETGTNLKEPWAFGPRIEAICRRALELRYQLLPYTYSLFHEAAQTGAPIMRPLAWHYPQDAATFNLADQFLHGRDLLVAPVLAAGASARAVYLPRDTWYRWGTDEALEGPRHVLAEAPLEPGGLPLYVRGGALLPMWPAAAHTGAVQREALRVHVWPGTGALDFYEDDGETRAYTRGEWQVTRFQVKASRAGLTLAWGKPQGGYPSPRTEWRFVFHGLKRGKATVDGKALRVRREAEGLAIVVPDDGRGHRVAVGE
jgi:alpha-glucosidase